MKSKRGFSLTELLVVVLILGILTAAALPGYEKAGRKAMFVEAEVTFNSLMKGVDAYLIANGYPGNATLDLTTLDGHIPWTECNSNTGWCTNKVGSWNVKCSEFYGTYSCSIYFWPNAKKMPHSGIQIIKGTTDEKWTWVNKDSPAYGYNFGGYTTTFQNMCDWWIKQGGRPVANNAKTIAEEKCGI